MTEEERAEILSAQHQLENSVPSRLRSFDIAELKASAQDHGYRQLYDLKDHAIATLADVMDRAKDETRLAAARDVLDRLGTTNKGTPQDENTSSIPSAAIGEALAFMVKAFGNNEQRSTFDPAKLKQANPDYKEPDDAT